MVQGSPPNETRTVPLAQLHPYPLQLEYYSNSSVEDDNSLAEDLRKRGQLDPIVVLPEDNAAGLPPLTMLDGHRRARLLAMIGVTEALVTLRHDLRDANAAAVEAEFLRYNLMRRQLHAIDKARVAKRLLELEKGKRRDGLVNAEEAEARDRVGRLIGVSGRNLQRYWNLLLTPLPVQRAVRDRKLPLVLGARVAGLSKAQQDQLASEIEGLTDAQAIRGAVVRCLPEPYQSPQMSAGNAVTAFAKTLAKVTGSLGDRLEYLTPRMAAEILPALTASQAVIQRIAWLAQQQQSQDG